MGLPIVIFWLVIMQHNAGGVTIPFDSKIKCEEAAKHVIATSQPRTFESPGKTIDAYCVESSIDLPL